MADAKLFEVVEPGDEIVSGGNTTMIVRSKFPGGFIAEDPTNGKEEVFRSSKQADFKFTQKSFNNVLFRDHKRSDPKGPGTRHYETSRMKPPLVNHHPGSSRGRLHRGSLRSRAHEVEEFEKELFEQIDALDTNKFEPRLDTKKFGLDTNKFRGAPSSPPKFGTAWRSNASSHITPQELQQELTYRANVINAIKRQIEQLPEDVSPSANIYRNMDTDIAMRGNSHLQMSRDEFVQSKQDFVNAIGKSVKAIQADINSHTN